MPKKYKMESTVFSTGIKSEDGKDYIIVPPFEFNFSSGHCKNCGNKNWGDCFVNSETDEIEFCDRCPDQKIIN